MTHVSMKHVLWLWLFVSLSAGAQKAVELGQPRMALMDDPVRIVFQQGVAPPPVDRVRQALAVAGSRGWRIVSESERRWELEREVRGKHTVRVALACDAAGCVIRYLDSHNLLYKEVSESGTTLRAIHRNYNNWIHELASSLAGAFAVPSTLIYGFAPISAVDEVPFLSEEGRQNYKKFLDSSKPRAFAVAPNGAWGWAGPSNYGNDGTASSAVQRCNQSGKGECKLYAADDQVVWTDSAK